VTIVIVINQARMLGMYRDILPSNESHRDIAPISTARRGSPPRYLAAEQIPSCRELE
jgi:hypothetical protein